MRQYNRYGRRLTAAVLVLLYKTSSQYAGHAHNCFRQNMYRMSRLCKSRNEKPTNHPHNVIFHNSHFSQHFSIRIRLDYLKIAPRNFLSIYHLLCPQRISSMGCPHSYTPKYRPSKNTSASLFQKGWRPLE